MMNPGELWIIVNLCPQGADLNVLDTDFGWDATPADCAFLPENVRPSCIHLSAESAEKECLRLAAKHGGEFVIFKVEMFADFVDSRPDVWRLNKISDEEGGPA